MTAGEFVTQAKAIASNYNTVYDLGAYGRYVGDNTFAFDCSGLVKSIGWGFDGSFDNLGGGTMNVNVPNTTAGGLISSCHHVSTDFSEVLPGELLYLYRNPDATGEHCAIYVGNGLAVEATVNWGLSGVIYSSVYGLNPTEYLTRMRYDWQSHGRLPWIDYSGLYLDGDELVYLDEFGNRPDLSGVKTLTCTFDLITGVMQNVLGF